MVGSREKEDVLFLYIRNLMTCQLNSEHSTFRALLNSVKFNRTCMSSVKVKFCWRLPPVFQTQSLESIPISMHDL